MKFNFKAKPMSFEKAIEKMAKEEPAAFTVNGWIYKQIPEEKGGFLAVFFLRFCCHFVIDL